MKKILLLFLFTTISGTVTAQEKPEPIKRNTVFLEFLGNSSFVYSLNYDRILINEPTWKIAFRLGASYYSEKTYQPEKTNSTMVIVPLEVSYLRGRNNHYLELGLGATYDYNRLSSSYSWEKDLGKYGRIGYRFQNKNGGPFFKAGFTPRFDLVKYHFYMAPSAGIAFGYTF